MVKFRENEMWLLFGDGKSGEGYDMIWYNIIE